MVAGRTIACRLVRKACERHLRDLRDGPARGLRWSAETALYAIGFFRFCCHSKGDLRGQAIRLEPWQKFAVGCLFGWLRRDGARRFRTGYWEIPKKNGKTLLAAGLGLLGMVGDGELGAEVYSAATQRDQARLVFDPAKEMVRWSPPLARRIRRFRLNLSDDSTGSKFEPLSSDEDSTDGLNPHFVVVDELHRHKSRALLNLMDAGNVARRQPMLIIITTAGDTDPASAYAVEHARAEKIVTGALEDDTYFAFVACADDPERWDDPGQWALANPNLGVSVKLDALARLTAKAKASPTDKADFLRYHLNIRQAASTQAIDMDVWAANAGDPLDAAAVALLKGRRCCAGIDLSAKQDISAIVLVFPPLGDERWVILPWCFTPEATLDRRGERDRAPYRQWCADGWMEATEGNVIDHARIGEKLRELAKQFQVESVAIDPWNATQLTTELLGDGLPVVEFIQGGRSYNEPTKLFLDMLAERRWRHGGHPVLTWMASNLHLGTDKNLNVMPHKQRSTGRIDAIAAGIMALARAVAPAAGPRSFWETMEFASA